VNVRLPILSKSSVVSIERSESGWNVALAMMARSRELTHVVSLYHVNGVILRHTLIPSTHAMNSSGCLLFLHLSLLPHRQGRALLVSLRKGRLSRRSIHHGTNVSDSDEVTSTD
jgi:hypothetical protein